MAISTFKLERKLFKAQSAKRKAEHRFLIFTMQREYFGKAGIAIPDNLEIPGDAVLIFSQFAEIEKEGVLGLSYRERDELSGVLDVFIERFGEIEQAYIAAFDTLHAIWEKRFGSNL